MICVFQPWNSPESAVWWEGRHLVAGLYSVSDVYTRTSVLQPKHAHTGHKGNWYSGFQISSITCWSKQTWAVFCIRCVRSNLRSSAKTCSHWPQRFVLVLRVSDFFYNLLVKTDLGCILYQMCTLEPPFFSQNMLTLATKVTGTQGFRFLL